MDFSLREPAVYLKGSDSFNGQQQWGAQLSTSQPFSSLNSNNVQRQA